MLSALLRALPRGIGGAGAGAGAGGGDGAGAGINASSGTMPVVQGTLTAATAALRGTLLDRARGLGVLNTGITVGTAGTGMGTGIGIGASGGEGGGPPHPGLLVTMIALGSFFLAVLFFVLMAPPVPPGGGGPPPVYCTTSIGLFGGIM